MSTIHFRNWPGNPDRPALALHCMLGSGRYWGPIVDRLNDRITLTAFDFPGHGRSAPWEKAADGPDFHTTITRIAASQIDRPLDLIGHSGGATVALRIAVAAPDAVRSLTLIEPVMFAAAHDPIQSLLDRDMLDLMEAGKVEEATRHFVDMWGGQPYDQLSEAAQTLMRQQIHLLVDMIPTLADDTANILREGGLEAIDAPVMIMTGAESPPAIHAVSQALAHRLPDVGQASVPGAGHMLPITHPDEVAGLIAVNLDRAA